MIIDFKPFHFRTAKLSPAVKERLAPQIEKMSVLAEHFMAGTSVAHRSTGTKILGIIGVIPSDKIPHCGEVFVLPTVDVKEFPVEFARDVKGALGYARQHFAKIRALGEKDDKFFKRWFAFLGMKRIGMDKKSNQPIWELA